MSMFNQVDHRLKHTDVRLNAAENDTLLYCRVMRWAETPILITESKIKLIRYLLIAYSLFL